MWDGTLDIPTAQVSTDGDSNDSDLQKCLSGSISHTSSSVPYFEVRINAFNWANPNRLSRKIKTLLAVQVFSVFFCITWRNDGILRDNMRYKIFADTGTIQIHGLYPNSIHSRVYLLSHCGDFRKWRSNPRMYFFQQDGSPPQYAAPIRELLYQHFPNTELKEGSPWTFFCIVI